VAIGAAPQPPASPDEAIRHAQQLRAQGNVPAALQRLKLAVQRFPAHEALRHALASAYLADENDFWALNVLREYAEAHPPACSTHAWMAWIQVRQANLDVASELLDEAACDQSPQMRARFLLLRAMIARQRGDDEGARNLVRRAGHERRSFEEDRAMLDALLLRDDPGHLPLAAWRADLAAGWTSNGLSGSPADPADAGRDNASPLATLDTRIRFILPASRSLRPVVEAQLRALAFTADSVSELGYRQTNVRPGVLLGDMMPRLLLTYGFDAVQLQGGDRYDAGPIWYSEAHRFDYELEATDELMAFGGAGHRWYRESGRTRWEFEQGLVAGTPVTQSLRLMTGASARWHRAQNNAYHGHGGTLLAQLLWRLPAAIEARLNASLSYDDYPNSRGYFRGSDGASRTDLQTRFKPGLWSPSWSGLRLGFDYEYTHRSSTAAAYTFSDHRLLLHGTWTMDSDRFGVHTIPTQGRVPLPHSIGTAGSMADEELRIRDLMRQDESVKRGSSCMN
jgi:hypothetical protein